MRKRIIWTAVCLALCLAVSAFGGAAAERTERTDTVEKEFSFQFRVDPEEAERQYLNGLFGLPTTPEEDLPKARGTAGGDSFKQGSREKILYTTLRSRVEQVAAGTLTSTKFIFDDNSDGFEATAFTAQDLGLKSSELFGSDGQPSAAATEKIWDMISPWVGNVANAVLYDCPYETFWRNSGYGIAINRTWYLDGENQPTEPIVVTSVTVKIGVSAEYQDESAGKDAPYTVNGSKINSAISAVNNAQAIIDSNAGLGDYDKLRAYKDAIRGLTDYNYPAATPGYPYGDPWQMVYVFDGDPETKVVCEGYSKAFYYLCDKSTWSSSEAVETICVSGHMWTRNGNEWSPGAHMWNIVRLNGKYYLADVTNSGNTGLFLDGYDGMLNDKIYIYKTGITQYGYSFDDGTIALYQSNGWLALEAEAAVYPNQTATTNAVWGISSTEVLPGEEFTVYVTYDGQELYDIVLRMVQGDRIIRYNGDGNSIYGTFSAANSTEPISIRCMGRPLDSSVYTDEEIYCGALTVNPGREAPVPVITMTGGRATTTDGLLRFRITPEAPDSGDYSDVRYEITPVGEGGGRLSAIDGDFTAGTTQTLTMEQVAETGLYIAENITFRLEARAYGPGYESATATSPKIYVTGKRDEGFTITGEYMTGIETAQMAAGEDNLLTVTAPDGVDSIRVFDGNAWSSYSIDMGNEILIAGYYEETADVPLVARYTTAAGENRYSNVIFTDYVETPEPPAPIAPESIMPGEDAVIIIPATEGADGYNITVRPWNGDNIYEIDSPQPGTFVIPAAVFADGFDGAIFIDIYANPEGGGTEELYWDYFAYTVEAYTGMQTLTIYEGAYDDGLLTIDLSVTDAERVIVQEKDYMDGGQMPIPYWTTICVADNPGATVDVRPKARKEHLIRAAVKKNGVWSAWSPVIEATTPIHGWCNESIEWTLSDSGKLTISGTGEIPFIYDMDDPWYDLAEEITEIEIGNGITGTGNSTFYHCTNLTTVTIPATLTSIGENAFGECEKLTTITAGSGQRTEHKRCYDGIIKEFSLPGTVTEIGYCAFIDTPAFGVNTILSASFRIPRDTGKIEAYAFFGIPVTSVQMQTYGLDSCEIEDYAFGNCTSLRYFQADDWGEAVSYSIAEHAFDGCTNLTFIGEYNDQLRQYAEDHGFTYLENEAVWGNG